MTQKTYLQHVNILVPPRTSWQPDLAEQFMVRLFAISGTLTLRIESHHKGLLWSVVVQNTQVQALLQTVYALYPQATVEVAATKPAIGYQLFQFQSSEPFVMPLMYVQDYNRQIDPITILLSALYQRHSKAHYIFECQLSPVDGQQIEAGRRFLKKSDLSWLQFITVRGATQGTIAKATGAHKSDRFATPMQRTLEKKLNSPLRAVKLTFKTNDDATAVRNFLSLLGPALAAYSRPGGNALVPSSRKESYPLILSPPEIAALWHLPNQACAEVSIAWSTSSVRPAPFVASVTDDVLLGVNRYQGKSTPVGIAHRDRDTHINLIGKTGTGKSTLLHQMTRQDIARGAGVAIIDPHGDLVRDILHCSIPTERIQDVVLFSLRDYEHPIGLNILAAPESLSPDVVASHALAVLRKIFSDQWSATRMEDALYAALLTLQAVPDSTIQDIPRLFADSQFRRQVLTTVTDPVALEFWIDEFEAYSVGQQQQIAQPINNRIRKLYRDKTLQRIVCQKTCLDFQDIINSGKILLADLGGGAEINAEVLGTLLVSKIQMAAMSRASLRPEMRLPFYLYIDELQNFTTTSLPKILSEARKYGLCLTMGNQFLYQLTGKTLEAVQGNMGATVIFRVGYKDARALTPYVRPEFSEQDLVDLNKFNVIVKMQRAGQTIPAFNLQTLPTPSQAGDSEERVQLIRDLSRTQFGRPRPDVDNDLSERFRRVNGKQTGDAENSYFD